MPETMSEPYSITTLNVCEQRRCKSEPPGYSLFMQLNILMDFPKHNDTRNMGESILCLNKLVMPTSPVLHTKAQCHWHFGYHQRSFKAFFSQYYMGMATILVTGHVSRTILNELLCPHEKMSMKYEKNWLNGFTEDA